MSKKIALTKAQVAALPPGTYADTKQSGLVLRVTATSRRFGLYCWINGSPVKRSIGLADEWDLSDVREEAARLIRELKGAPTTTRHTLGEVADEYALRCANKNHRTNYIEGIMRLSWEHWRQMPLDKITPLMVLQHHNKIVRERGPQAGRRAVRGLHTLFNFATKLQMTRNNPALGVETASAPSRDVALNEKEIKVMRECLDEMAPAPRHFFLLCLLTGLRKSNVVRMQKDWISLEAATVTVPRASSKNKTLMVIPLMPEALEIVRQRMALPGDYIFPGKSGGCLASPQCWLRELRKKMRERGVTTDWHIHDLRRTVATQMLAADIPMPVIAALLGHITIKSTEVYARSNAEMVRSALARI